MAPVIGSFAAGSSRGFGQFQSVVGGFTPSVNFSNVVALLPCDGVNGSTTFTDVSSSPKTVTATNTTVNTTTKKYGTGSANFGSGNNGYLAFTSEITFSGNFTVEFWAYLTAISPSGYSLGTSATTVNSQFPSFQNNGVIGYYNAGSSFASTSGKFSLNAWFHCATVRSSNVVKIYVDGVEVLSGSDANALYIKNISGYNGGAGGYNILGYLDDIRICNSAVYTSNFTPPPSALPTS